MYVRMEYFVPDVRQDEIVNAPDESRTYSLPTCIGYLFAHVRISSRALGMKLEYLFFFAFASSISTSVFLLILVCE
jgi:hypothetical protein